MDKIQGKKIHSLIGTIQLSKSMLNGIEIIVPYLYIETSPSGEHGGQELNSYFRLFNGKKVKITIEEI